MVNLWCQLSPSIICKICCSSYRFILKVVSKAELENDAVNQTSTPVLSFLFICVHNNYIEMFEFLSQ